MEGALPGVWGWETVVDLDEKHALQNRSSREGLDLILLWSCPWWEVLSELVQVYLWPPYLVPVCWVFPVDERVASLHLHMVVHARILVWAYVPNCSSEYSFFFESLVGVLVGILNAHVGNDSVTWKDMMGRNGLSVQIWTSVLLSDPCASHGLSCRSVIDFVVASSDLQLCFGLSVQRSCWLIPTWRWVASDGGGRCQTDPLYPEM